MELQISIHAPTNGATTEWLCLTKHLIIFQSTLRRTERPSTMVCLYGQRIFQSTLRRTERRFMWFISFLMIISIHAPTNGATLSPKVTTTGNGISIHAPTNGATALSLSSKLCLMVFQSTLRRTERLVQKHTDQATY